MGVNGTDIGLAELLNLATGRLQGPPADRIRRLIRDHAELSLRWRMVRVSVDHAANLSPALPPAEPAVDRPPRSDDVPAASPELVGAWLDGTLDAATRDRLEAACWRSPEFLREVVEVFLLLADVEAERSDRRRRQRLEQLDSMVAWDDSDAGRRASSDPLPRSAPALPSGAVAPRAGESARRRVKRPSRSWVGVAVAAAALLLIPVTAVLVVRYTMAPDRRRVTESPSRPDDARPDRAMPAPRIVQDRANGRSASTGSRPNRSPSPNGAREIDRRPARQMAATDNRRREPRNGETRDRETEDRGTQRAPQTDVAGVRGGMPKHQEPAADRRAGSPRADRPAIEWVAHEGLVLRAVGHRWRGFKASGVEAEGEAARFRALSRSWAKGRWESVGDVVVDADTVVGFEMTPSSDGAVSHRLRLEQGRVAVRFRESESAVDLLVGRVRWSVLPESSVTDMVVERREGGPRVVVLKGRVEINGVLVKKRQAYHGGEGVSVVKNTESYAFVQRPKHVAHLPGKVLEQLSGSPNIADDLRQLIGDSATGQVATPWLLSLERGADIVSLLAHADGGVRTAAAQWLLTERLDRAGEQAVYRRLAAEVRDPVALRRLHEWYYRAQMGRAPEPKELVVMSHTLRHPHLAVRHATAFLLARHLGRLPNYDPAAPEMVRNAAADQIRKNLIQRLRRSSVPQRSSKVKKNNRGAKVDRR